MAITLTFDNEQLGGELAFQTSARQVLSFVPAAPATGATSVTETIRVWFHSGLINAMEGTGILRDLAQYFNDARDRQAQQSGYRIYLEFDKGAGTDGTWRTEVLDGRIIYPPETLGAAYLPSDTGEVTIIVTHKPYWEKDTEYEMPLSIGGTYATGGRAIKNHHDAGAGDINWVTWEAQAVIGDLPSPLRVEFTNTDASRNLRRLHMAVTHKVHDTSDYTLNWSIEGEDNTHNPGTVTVDSNSSDGNYMVEQWTATTETKVFSWQLANTDFGGGNPFRIMARFLSNNYDNLYARLTLSGTGSVSTELWRSRLAKAGYGAGTLEELSDLGVIAALPPGIPEGVSGGAIIADLYFLRDTAGTHTVNLDHLTFMPMDGGYRVIESVASSIGLADTETLIDDGILERTYKETALLVTSGGWRGDGEYLKVYPSKGGRLTLLWQNTINTAPANMTASVRLYYRPRRASL